MATDLKAVKDHPAQILHDRDPSLIRDDGKDLGSVRYAANILWAHESNNNVTFAALDNDAIKAVREAYEQIAACDGYVSWLRLQALMSAIDGLLGMGE